MSTLTENVLAADSENRPLMFEKGGYDTWQSHMLLYIEGRENGQMLLDLIFLGLFQFIDITIPINEEARRAAKKRMQTLTDLTPKEKTRIGCDIKAAKIILQGLPNDIYTILNHKTKAYAIWYRLKELMEGT
ncbi:hypothetical protein Tco_0757525 [Tanacetum coccineum]